jgi:hypothetical protein
MSLRSTFKTDNALETQGKKFVIGINNDESEQYVILARMGKANKPYIKLIERLTAPHRAAIEHGSIPEKLSTKIVREAFAREVVKGWGGLRESEWTGNDADTKEVKFTPEKAMELFEQLPDLYDDWADKARAASNFRAEQLKEEAKN